MAFDWSKVLETLGGRPAGTLQSPAPGTGPTQAESVATPSMPGFLGGPAIPRTEPATESGYGGTGDPTPPNAPHSIDVQRVRPAIPGAVTPRFSKLYGPLRSEGDAWRFVNAGIATGTWTPATSTQLLPVTLTQSNATPNKLYQWAGAISVYWVIQFFSFAPVAATMTGNQAISFLGTASNNAVPLGVWQGKDTALYASTIIVDAPVTDPTTTTVGQLQVVGSTIATAAVCTWQMGIGLAYLLPDPLFGLYQNDAGLTHEQDRVYAQNRERR